MANLPSNLPSLLRKHGLKVVEVDGWRDRGRPASTGGFAPVGVLCHHTASSANGQAALGTLIHGRPDLPGPLCQLSLDRQGVVYIVAAGRANHAGVAKPSGSVAGGDGNTLYIGIEAQNRGTGEPWPKVQYDAYVLLCAALSVEVTHNSVRTVRAHKETSVTGKIDPAGPTPYEKTFDMDKFRTRVAAKMVQIQAAPEPAPVNLPPTRLSNFWDERINHKRVDVNILDRAHKAGRNLHGAIPAIEDAMKDIMALDEHGETRVKRVQDLWRSSRVVNMALLRQAAQTRPLVNLAFRRIVEAADSIPKR